MMLTEVEINSAIHVQVDATHDGDPFSRRELKKAILSREFLQGCKREAKGYSKTRADTITLIFLW